jgi:phospholipid/cholesterol/gamma-HCH transport system substrate-binding protein
VENRSHALIAGLFLLLLGAALAAAVVWFRGDNLERVSYTVVARAGVPGLLAKAAVRLRGVDVGSVESIAFDRADARRILVRVAIDAAAPVTRGTVAQLGYQGVTGLSYIDLSDRGDDPRPMSALPDAERVLELRPSLVDQLTTGGPALLTAFAETAERLNALLAPQNQQRVQRLLDSGERGLEGVAQSAEELRPALAALAPAIRRLAVAGGHADATLQRLDSVFEQTKLLTAEVRARLPVLDRAGDAARRVESAVHAIEMGLVGADAASSPPLLDTLARAARGVDRAAGQWAEQPQSVIFGRAPPPPGPGETGFDARTAGAR